MDPQHLKETRRVLALCNLCGYCNGFCPVFSAAQRHSVLRNSDLQYLAHLCHNCRNCFYACQYAPPHVFAVNLPRSLSENRQWAYQNDAWPSLLGCLFYNNGRKIQGVMLSIMLLSVIWAWCCLPAGILFMPQHGAGAFYRVIPWDSMVTMAALPLTISLFSIGCSLRRFWRASCDQNPPDITAWRSALLDALTLRHLSGAGYGCNDVDGRFSQMRRWLHHAVFYGFLLCFLSTSIATLYHHLLGWMAPYALTSLPVILGGSGGIAMVLGCLGLAGLKYAADPIPSTGIANNAEYAFLGVLLLVASTGLMLLAGRSTAIMGCLLVLHLGTVVALFLLLPYSKFVHGFYRIIALAIFAQERRHPN